MTRKEAARWVRAGMALAKAYPERWLNDGNFTAWLMPDGTRVPRILPWDAHLGAVGACGCVLGLAGIAAGRGKMTLAQTFERLVNEDMYAALGEGLFWAISNASDDSESVPEMCERVEAVLRKEGL